MHGVLLGYPWRPILVAAADFDGSNDYMLRGAGLTGAADGKQGTVSFWVRLDGGDGSSLQILAGDTSLGGGGSERVSIARGQTTGTDRFEVRLAGADNTVKLLIGTGNEYAAGASWIHVAASWNLASPGARHLYVNGVSDVVQTTFVDADIDYTLADWAIGGDADGTDKMNGAIAELWFDDVFIDLSVAANLQKFRTATGVPADLGSDGSIPTGSAPLVYHALRKTDAVAAFATARGTGGNFAITGTLDLASSSPSDR